MLKFDYVPKIANFGFTIRIHLLQVIIPEV